MISLGRSVIGLALLILKLKLATLKTKNRKIKIKALTNTLSTIKFITNSLCDMSTICSIAGTIQGYVNLFKFYLHKITQSDSIRKKMLRKFPNMMQSLTTPPLTVT